MRFYMALLAFVSAMPSSGKHSHSLMFFVGMWLLWHACRSSTQPVEKTGKTENVCPRCHTASTLS